eukprot:CAMPEP_0168211812 /NCGR_PEP_ID=MMETSP0140_2-20121125/3920_1 /TAXON_ID=44445 /ORGANISM="Pseudo-nitzschia australis, Strain 10249 10 AB" /LENGTH=215 /DNA_ID=CAMNT_0008138539 /DNA_START=942 /DNA_END=1590 /DNA_ORIENTATION=+
MIRHDDCEPRGERKGSCQLLLNRTLLVDDDNDVALFLLPVLPPQQCHKHKQEQQADVDADTVPTYHSSETEARGSALLQEKQVQVTTILKKQQQQNGKNKNKQTGGWTDLDSRKSLGDFFRTNAQKRGPFHSFRVSNVVEYCFARKVAYLVPVLEARNGNDASNDSNNDSNNDSSNDANNNNRAGRHLHCHRGEGDKPLQVQVMEGTSPFKKIRE